MKKIFLLAAFAFSILAVAAQSNTTDEGVVINGVKWATRNVDAPGTFAANPEDVGMLYQWNRKTGWSAAYPTVNSNGGTTWDGSSATGDTWATSNDPSPAGWRVPTRGEIRALLDTDDVSHVLVNVNGVNGMKCTDKSTNNSIFLPLTGWLHGSTGSSANYSDKSTNGNYWSSTQYGTSGSNLAYALFFRSTLTTSLDYTLRNYGFAVRSVANTSSNHITDVKSNEEKTPVAYYSILGIQLQKEPESGMYIIVYDNGTIEKVVRQLR